MGEYVLADGVEQELNQIWEFIAKDNPVAATQVIEAAYETFAALAENPGLGHPRRFQSKEFPGPSFTTRFWIRELPRDLPGNLGRHRSALFLALCTKPHRAAKKTERLNTPP